MNAINTRSDRFLDLTDDCLDRPDLTMVCAIGPLTRCFAENRKMADETLDRPQETIAFSAGGTFSRAPAIERGDEALDRPAETVAMTGGMPLTHLCFAPEAKQNLQDEVLDRPLDAISLCCTTYPKPEASAAETVAETASSSGRVDLSRTDEPIDRPSRHDAHNWCSGCGLTGLTFAPEARQALADDALDRPKGAVSLCGGGEFCFSSVTPEARHELGDEALDRPMEETAYCASCKLTWGPEVADKVSDEALDRPEPALWSNPGCHLCWTDQPQAELADEALDRPPGIVAMCGCGLTGNVLCWAERASDDFADEALDRPVETLSLCCCRAPEGDDASLAEAGQDGPSLSDEALDRSPPALFSWCGFTEAPVREPAREQGDLSGKVVSLAAYREATLAATASGPGLDDEALDRPTDVVAATSRFCGLCQGPDAERDGKAGTGSGSGGNVLRMSDYRDRRLAA